MYLLITFAIASLPAFADENSFPPRGNSQDTQPFRHLYYVQPDYFQFGPATLTRPISENSLQWPLLLRNYLWYEADTEFVDQVVRQHLDKLFKHLDGFTDQHGLLTGTSTAWDSRDRPKGLELANDYGLVNALYFHALNTSAALMNDLGRSGTIYALKAEHVRNAFHQELLDAERNLFRDTPSGPGHSLQLNALAVCVGLADSPQQAATLGLVRAQGLACPEPMMAFVVEAAFRAGDPALALRLLDKLPQSLSSDIGDCDPPKPMNWSALEWCNPSGNGVMYLLAQEVLGLTPMRPGWSEIRLSPIQSDQIDAAKLTVTVPMGRISVRYAKNIGYKLTVPPDTAAHVDASDGISVMVKKSLSHAHAKLNAQQRAILEDARWDDRTKGTAGLWISVSDQVLRLIVKDEIVFQARCATAANGTGAEMNSLKTPLGWHAVNGKIGDDAPWGQVFRARKPTKEVWKPGDDVSEDLVLTRVLLLDGLEPGINKGGNVDSMARNIYIHGTNDEAKIGVPSSHGCIRMYNDEVIELFELIPDGTLVLITP